MRLTVCLEGNTEGKVLASIDMEEIVKMTITDDIEKSNFNPQMLKSCTDSSYQCGYQQGKKEGIREFAAKIKSHMIKYCHSRLEQQYCAEEIIDYIGKLMGEKDYSMDVETEMKKHDEAIRADERAKVIDELLNNGVMKLAVLTDALTIWIGASLVNF